MTEGRRVLHTLLAAVAAVAAGDGPALSWSECLRQGPEWYASQAAARVAENVIAHQRQPGGWPKNIDMAAELDQEPRAGLVAARRRDDCTIDNGATCEQLVFLGRVLAAKRVESFEACFLRGLDFLLSAQYSNGGWPQRFPLRSDYSRRITFNDDAMIGVLRLLRDIALGRSPYAFVGEERRSRCAAAVARGIECIRRCQVVVGGARTAWCAQHDEVTFEPAPARTYEKASLSGAESAGIVRFLLQVEPITPEVEEMVEGAVRWLERSRLAGIRVDAIAAPEAPGGRDRVVVEDAGAPPIWARFYELGGNRPIFCGRDGVVKYSLAEIEHERRNGYAWYTAAPRDLLERGYPAWRARKSELPAAAR